ncbi:hypothetical protein C942_03603 [Photobacterium marinum]|uniref:Uncharacterized protein n=1 Tax=Photobacterium marinum TaxID=1056511 RepID=L8J495_9GAMM|nr:MULTISPECIES: hypothetical protein [Photobacterium]ELR63586.1 hypothetical protein C942_03603 [Photobacterium marinum]
MKYKAQDLNYKGNNCGVHNWMTEQGKSFYWHPDWLHIAEDETGLRGKHELSIDKGDNVTKEHAVTAILKHLNNAIVKRIDNTPEFEEAAKEAEKELK